MKIQLPAFEDKRELFAYLVKNKKDIIELKKSAIKMTDGFGVSNTEATVIKDINSNPSTDTDSAITRTIVGNTYLFMDSHDDAHMPNLFSKSIQERAGKIWHLHDHLFELTAKVGIAKSVYESYIDWQKLGVNKTGQTQALFMDSTIMKDMNKSIFLSYKNNEITQHSVGMQYVKLSLCVNDEEYEQEYADWQTYIKMLGNPERAIEKGFFWAIHEAKLIEVSCVLEGSNPLTPTLNVSTVSDSTKQQPEPSTDVMPQPNTDTLNIKQLLTIF